MLYHFVMPDGTIETEEHERGYFNKKSEPTMFHKRNTAVKEAIKVLKELIKEKQQMLKEYQEEHKIYEHEKFFKI